jgi:hypothetical protein
VKSRFFVAAAALECQVQVVKQDTLLMNCSCTPVCIKCNNLRGLLLLVLLLLYLCACDSHVEAFGALEEAQAVLAVMLYELRAAAYGADDDHAPLLTLQLLDTSNLHKQQ